MAVDGYRESQIKYLIFHIRCEPEGRHGQNRRQGARKDEHTPGSEKGAGPDRQSGAHVGSRDLERTTKISIYSVLLLVNFEVQLVQDDDVPVSLKDSTQMATLEA